MTGPSKKTAVKNKKTPTNKVKIAIRPLDPGEPDSPASDRPEDADPHEDVSPVSNKENGEQPSNNNDHEIVDFQEPSSKDPAVLAQLELIKTTEPKTKLEIALSLTLERKQCHIERLTQEIMKLQKFVSKRKQTYKRKRKDDGAPTRALSAYNLFIKERFAQLAKENEQALKSDDLDAKLQRVPPSNLVTKTGNEWMTLSNEVKAKYEERAKADKQRYDKEMQEYQRPDGFLNRKRTKTGYNMFFSAHVLRLKQSESGVPSERGSVARLVGTAWKQLSAEDKAYYEREADRHNVQLEKDGEDEDHDDEIKRQQQQQGQQRQPQRHADYNPMLHPDTHLPPTVHPQHSGHPGIQHDPRQPQHIHYYPHPATALYGPPPYFDYSQHHQRQHHHLQAIAQGYQPQNFPAPRHYDS